MQRRWRRLFQICLGLFFAVSMMVFATPSEAAANFDVNQDHTVWTVTDEASFEAAVADIKAKGVKEATIELTQDITFTQIPDPDDTYIGDTFFDGIDGVQLTLTSDDKGVHKVKNLGSTWGTYNKLDDLGFDKDGGETVRCFTGDLVLDNIELVNREDTYYCAQGHKVIFTKNFKATHELNVIGGALGKYIRQHGIGYGNRTGVDNHGNVLAWKEDANGVASTHIEIYGGDFNYVIGGGYCSQVQGDTYVKIALDTQKHYGNNRHNIDNVYGGGYFGKNGTYASAPIVGGDTHVEAVSGTYGSIFGGGHHSRSTVSGNTYVTVGVSKDADTMGIDNFAARFGHVYGGSENGTTGGREGWDWKNGNVHLTINETAAGLVDSDQDTATILGGGDCDTINGTVEVVLNGGKDVDRVFVAGANSNYSTKTTINNYSEPKKEKVARLIINGGTWKEVLGCANTFVGTTPNNPNEINGDVEIVVNGGSIGRIHLSGMYTHTTGKSIATVNGGEFNSVPSIAGYYYDPSNVGEENDIKRGQVDGGREVHFTNSKTVELWQLKYIKNIIVDNTAPASIITYGSYSGLKNCDNIIINKGALALAGENTLRDTLTVGENGTLVLPATSKTVTDNSVLYCDKAANMQGNPLSGGQLLTVVPYKNGNTLKATTIPQRPVPGEVYVIAKTGTNETAQPSSKADLLTLANNEPDLYVEYTTDQAATTQGYNHAWRIAKDASVQMATVKYWSHQNANKNWVHSGDQSVAIGKTVGKLPADPTRSGYAFNGWTLTEDGSGAAFTADTVISQDLLQNNVVNVYGQWLPIVTFDANGGVWGTDETIKEVTADKSGKVQAPADPSISGGKVFAGWFTEKTGGDKVDPSKETFKEPTTLYAQWTTPVEKVTITYSEDGAPQGVTVPQAATIDKGTTYNSEQPNTVDGWMFEGWFTDKDLQNKYQDGTAINQDLTLYGKWTQTFTVTYTDGVDGEEIFADKVIIDIKKGDATPAFGADPTRDGYTFIGWKPEVATTVTANATYTAQWEKNTTPGPGPGPVVTKVTLHYESNGGTAYADESYDKGAVVTLDKHPIRAGYSFTGWYADKACTDKIDSITMTGNKTVYAGWEQTAVPPVFRDDHISYIVGFVDGKVKPLADITRSEVATIFYRLLDEEVRDANTTDQNSFSDVDGNAWYNVPASTMAAMGIVAGYPDGDFHGSDSITRAEFAAIAARFDAETDNTGAAFSDISGHWAEKDIVNAANKGWIMGYPDGTFRPNQTITRAEAMSLINRVLQRNPNTPNDLLEGMIEWPDNMDTEKWYYLPVQEATNSHDYARKDDGTETWTALNN